MKKLVFIFVFFFWANFVFAQSAIDMTYKALYEKGNTSCNPKEAYAYLKSKASSGLKIEPKYVDGKYIDGIDPELACRLYNFLKSYPQFKIVSAYRSKADQAKICSGRYGNSCARPGNSCHQYGLAVDVSPANSSKLHYFLQSVLPKFKLHLAYSKPNKPNGHIQCIEHKVANRFNKNGCTSPCAKTDSFSIDADGSSSPNAGVAGFDPQSYMQQGQNMPYIDYGEGLSPNQDYLDPNKYNYNDDYQNYQGDTYDGGSNYDSFEDFDWGFTDSDYYTDDSVVNSNYETVYTGSMQPFYINHELKEKVESMTQQDTESIPYNSTEPSTSNQYSQGAQNAANDSVYVTTGGAIIKENKNFQKSAAESILDIVLVRSDSDFALFLHKNTGKIDQDIYNKVPKQNSPLKDTEDFAENVKNALNSWNYKETKQENNFFLDKYKSLLFSSFDVTLNLIVPGFASMSSILF